MGIMVDIVDVILRSMSIYFRLVVSMRTQHTFCICYIDYINQQIEKKTRK